MTRSQESNVMLGVWYGVMPGVVLSCWWHSPLNLYVMLLGGVVGMVIGWRRPHA